MADPQDIKHQMTEAATVREAQRMMQSRTYRPVIDALYAANAEYIQKSERAYKQAERNGEPMPLDPAKAERLDAERERTNLELTMRANAAEFPSVQWQGGGLTTDDVIFHTANRIQSDAMLVANGGKTQLDYTTGVDETLRAPQKVPQGKKNDGISPNAVDEKLQMPKKSPGKLPEGMQPQEMPKGGGVPAPKMADKPSGVKQTGYEEDVIPHTADGKPMKPLKPQFPSRDVLEKPHGVNPHDYVDASKDGKRGVAEAANVPPELRELLKNGVLNLDADDTLRKLPPKQHSTIPRPDIDGALERLKQQQSPQTQEEMEVLKPPPAPVKTAPFKKGEKDPSVKEAPERITQNDIKLDHSTAKVDFEVPNQIPQQGKMLGKPVTPKR